MKTFLITFKFIENNHECKTSWTGTAVSESAAVDHAKAWFGFEEDGIEVISMDVQTI